jgi:hypothetical protein
MTDNDNLLIENFFKEAAQQQIEDNGFTERVMERVVQTKPSTRRMSILWTWSCVAIALVLFVFLGGWESLKATMMVWMTTALTSLEVLITTAPTTELPVNPAVVFLLVAFVIVYLPYRTARMLSAIQ